jgi:hypothetical protein
MAVTQRTNSIGRSPLVALTWAASWTSTVVVAGNRRQLIACVGCRRTSVRCPAGGSACAVACVSCPSLGALWLRRCRWLSATSRPQLQRWS